MGLRHMPPEESLLSYAGLKSYQVGYRPTPKSVFDRVQDIIDYYMDFSCSFGSQEELTEMLALFTLSSWFLPAFKKIGYVWMSGDKGSGKSQLLYTIGKLGHLGTILTHGGSFASLRDMADYGGCLCFDDTDEMLDTRRVDPDKKSLILAGNKCDTKVPVMEKQSHGGWEIRYIHAFCPRMFSATKLPSSILASRCIIIPLVKTVNPRKAQRDPTDTEAWPHDYRKLVDDLWLLALEHSTAVKKCYNVAVNNSHLWGRDLEPWVAILTVAKWYEKQAEKDGVWKRMNNLSRSYKAEDLTDWADTRSLVAKSIINHLNHINRHIRYIREGNSSIGYIDLTTQQILEGVQTIASAEDLDPREYTTRRLGWTLRKLRLSRPQSYTGGPRSWRITFRDIRRLALSYSPNDELTNKTISQLDVLENEGTIKTIKKDRFFQDPNGLEKSFSLDPDSFV